MPDDNKKDYEDFFIENIGKKNWYGIKIMVICIIFIIFISLLTYYAESIKNNTGNIALFIIALIALIIALSIAIKIFWPSETAGNSQSILETFTYFEANYIFIIISLFFLIFLGIIFGIAFGNDTKDNPNVFSNNADYTVINTYILSSIVLWFVMILVILVISSQVEGGGVWGILSPLIIIILFMSSSLTKRYYEVNDNTIWIRSTVKTFQGIRIEVENKEYGDQGENNVDTKNTYIYGDNCRDPKNPYKIGDNVRIIDPSNTGTINGFKYDVKGEISHIYIKNDGTAYSISNVNKK